MEDRIFFVKNIKEKEHMLMFKNSLRLIQNIKMLKKNQNQHKPTKKPPLLHNIFLRNKLSLFPADQERAASAHLKHWLCNPLRTQIRIIIQNFHIVKIRTSRSFLSGNTCTASVSGQKVNRGVCSKKLEKEGV